jgi:hypothetical protein
LTEKDLRQKIMDTVSAPSLDAPKEENTTTIAPSRKPQPANDRGKAETSITSGKAHRTLKRLKLTLIACEIKYMTSPRQIWLKTDKETIKLPSENSVWIINKKYESHNQTSQLSG